MLCKDENNIRHNQLNLRFLSENNLRTKKFDNRSNATIDIYVNTWLKLPSCYVLTTRMPSEIPQKYRLKYHKNTDYNITKNTN